MDTTPQPEKKKNEVEEVGGIFGITLIVILLVAGGIYFLLMQQQKMEGVEQQPQEQTQS